MMKILINNKRKIFAIQKEFSEMFPGLKIAFYAKPSKPGGEPSLKLMKQSSKTLQECRANSNEGSIEIQQSMHLLDLKNNFRDVYGLTVEIFEKPGNGSSDIPVIDNLSLEEINNKYFK